MAYCTRAMWYMPWSAECNTKGVMCYAFYKWYDNIDELKMAQLEVLTLECLDFGDENKYEKLQNDVDGVW